MKKAIVKIEMEYYFPNRYTENLIMEALENKELPREYREDSWEFVKILKEGKNEE